MTLDLNSDNSRFSFEILKDPASSLDWGIDNYMVTSSYKIPKQKLIVKGFRVQVNSVVTALASGTLYIDIRNRSGKSIMSYLHLIDNNRDITYFPLPLDYAIVTNKTDCSYVLNMAADLDSELYVTVYSKKYSAGGGVVAVDLDVIRLFLDVEMETGALLV